MKLTDFSTGWPGLWGAVHKGGAVAAAAEAVGTMIGLVGDSPNSFRIYRWFEIACLLYSLFSRRCGYLSKEANILWQLQEEVANLPAEAQTDVISPFAMALQGSGSGGGGSGGGGPKSQLARSLKTIFEDISHNGYCYERIHNYIEISFCMPQKVYKRLNPCLEVEPESIW